MNGAPSERDGGRWKARVMETDCSPAGRRGMTSGSARGRDVTGEKEEKKERKKEKSDRSERE